MLPPRSCKAVGDTLGALEGNAAMSNEKVNLESLLLEWHIRRGQGEDPSAEEICRDAPELCAELRKEIDRQKRLLQRYGVGEWPHQACPFDTDSNLPRIPSGSRMFGDRFYVTSQLGVGGMGVVYRAYDRERKADVAIKQLRHFDPAGIYRLKREFRSLADLVHPNILKLYELFAEVEACFYTMEVVEGVSFREYVRPSQSLDQAIHTRPAQPLGESSQSSPVHIERLRAGLRQLVEGVSVLHRAGKLHRDIKPGNVLVTRQGRVVLLDFGLAWDVKRSNLEYSTEISIAGTVAYMSPEQVVGTCLTEASDWYSVGVMLYEALTGRLPFQGEPFSILTQKQSLEPLPPAEIQPEVPEDLNSLCVQLLRSRAEDRPPGRDVLRQVSHFSTGCYHQGEVTSIQRAEQQLPFVGRITHLSVLDETFEAIKNGAVVAVRVHGQPGVGKTTLVHQFLAGLKERGEAVVLSARCYERESMPFPAVDSLIDALSGYLRKLPEPEVAALLPRALDALTRLFPVLQRVAAVAKAPSQRFETRDHQELRQRGFYALRELLARLSDRHPLVLYVDDLQWGDVDSAVLLADLLRPHDQARLLLIVSYRSEDASSPCVRTLMESHEGPDKTVEWRELRVEPLRPAEAKELALALLQPIPQIESTAEVIAHESGGNPWFIELASSIAEGTLSLDSGDPLFFEEALWQRISRLPEAARCLLEVIAVAGRPLAQVDAFEAARIGTEGQGALNHLRSARCRLLRTTGSSRNELETYHDIVRETVLRHLTPDISREYHRQLASALETSSRADPETLVETSHRADPEALVFHWQGAGEPVRAGEHAARAAARADGALAFDQAAKLYELAIELLPADVSSKWDLRTKLAHALANAGYGVEAAKAYRAAAVSMRGSAQVERQRCAAAQLIRSGHIDEGLIVLRGVLNSMGLELAKTPGRSLFSALIQRIRLRLQGLRFRERDVGQIPPDELSRVDTCWSVSTALGMIDNIRGADFSARHLLLALRAGEPSRIACALAVEGAYSAAISWGRRRASRLLRSADALARQLEHPHALAIVKMATGYSAFLAGDWPRAHKFCDDAGDDFRDHCTGVAWELDTSRTMSLWALFFMGEVALIRRRLPVLLREAHERGNLYAATNFATLVGHLLWLADDDPSGARCDLDTVVGKWSQEGVHIQHVTAAIAQTQIDLYEGFDVRARSRLIDRWPKLNSSLLLHALQVVRIATIELRARTALAVAMGMAEPKPLLKAAERDARLLEREKVPWSRALAKLIRGGIAARRGDGNAAKALFAAAASACDDVSMKLFAAAARRRLGELLGGDEGRMLMTKADDCMKHQTIKDSARMTAMLAPGFRLDVASDSGALQKQHRSPAAPAHANSHQVKSA
jgi:serine/threonine protein kinase